MKTKLIKQKPSQAETKKPSENLSEKDDNSRIQEQTQDMKNSPDNPPIIIEEKGSDKTKTSSKPETKVHNRPTLDSFIAKRLRKTSRSVIDAFCLFYTDHALKYKDDYMRAFEDFHKQR